MVKEKGMTEKPEPAESTLASPAAKASVPTASKPAAKKKEPAQARPELERELASRLSFLRQAAREAGHNYVINLEHDLIVLAEAVREIFRSKQGPDRKELLLLERAVEIADCTKLKPAKGRRKDLKRIEQAVAKMQKLLIKKK